MINQSPITPVHAIPVELMSPRRYYQGPNAEYPELGSFPSEGVVAFASRDVATALTETGGFDVARIGHYAHGLGADSPPDMRLGDELSGRAATLGELVRRVQGFSGVEYARDDLPSDWPETIAHRDPSDQAYPLVRIHSGPSPVTMLGEEGVLDTNAVGITLEVDPVRLLRVDAGFAARTSLLRVQASVNDLDGEPRAYIGEAPTQIGEGQVLCAAMGMTGVNGFLAIDEGYLQDPDHSVHIRDLDLGDGSR
jgi:hypothetical protein